MDRKYFDRIIPEEDNPIEVDEKKQDNYKKLETIFEEFYDENYLHMAKESSKEERDNKKLTDSSFVYGEITFRSFSYIFEYIKSVYGENAFNPGAFYDLGSGVGRGLLAAAFLHNFDKTVGIEYLENLHNFAVEGKEKYDKNFGEVLKEHADLFGNITKPIPYEVFNGDFLKFDWNEASFLFANSTCFSSELMQSLSEKAEELKKGTFFVTFTKKLPNLSENWEIRDGFRRVMSWGIATIYVHRKIQ